MHIVINGWFIGHLEAGSGQYLHHLLAYLPRRAPEHRYTLLVPAGREQAHAWSDVALVSQALPPMPRQLAKVWWEQVTTPHAAHDLGADVLWVPYWAAPRRQPVPTVVTVHDIIPRLLPAYRGDRRQQLYTRLVSNTARRAAAIITVSEASRRDVIAELGVAPERVIAIPHGPNSAREDALTPTHLAAVRTRYQLPARYFLYLGGFDVRKNVGGILAAYRRYLDRGGNSDVKLVIAGKLPVEDSGFAPAPQKMAAEMALHDAVHFCGFVADEDKPALYHLAVAYLFPSLYEGFGMPILEAMQAGTPVVTSAC